VQNNVAVAVLCIAVGGIAAQWVAWRLRLPAIVLLFLIGLAVGPGLGLLQPSHGFGPALRPIIGLAVALVVFEGGLALDVQELRQAGGGVLRLTTVALPINALLGTLCAHLLTPMAWSTAALFGTITVVTGPTVVLPLLRQTRLERRATSFLKWEAIVNDPVGAILTALVLQIVVAPAGHAPDHLALRVAGGLALAIALGAGAALLVRQAFRHDQIPEILKTPILLATAFGLYAVSNAVLEDAGLAAATMFGVVLANLRLPGLSELRRFKEALVVLVVSALFIVLTADLHRDVLRHVSWRVLALTLAMLLVARPVAILLATVRSDLTWPERLLPAWIAPRGIVAAAIAGIAGLRLQGAGAEGADLIMPAVFALIAASMLLHGFTLRPLARRLGLTLDERPGLALVGASDWSLQMARALHEGGVPVLLVDTFPGALTAARNASLPVLQAELLSEHGRDELDGLAVDYLLAVTADEIYNAMLCSGFASEFGRERVFQLAPKGGFHDQERGVSRELRGKLLGEPALDYQSLAGRFQAGWRFELSGPVRSPGPDDKGAEGAPAEATSPGEEDGVVLLSILPNGALRIRSPEAPTEGINEGARNLLFRRPAADAGGVAVTGAVGDLERAPGDEGSPPERRGRPGRPSADQAAA